MVSTLKEKPNGGFYCSECRMSIADLTETCPFCGSVISNYEAIIAQNNTPDIIIGGRWWETPVEEIGPEPIDEEAWNKIVSIVRRKKE